MPSALLNLSLSEKIMKNALSRERFCVYRSRKSRKARENEKVHVSVPKSRGVPKVMCLRGCVPKVVKSDGILFVSLNRVTKEAIWRHAFSEFG